MTFGSLFAGIGGFDLGLERAGMRCKWQVEIDDYCRRVLAKHWPDVERLEDVRECGAHNLESVDLICGGFPCQPVSCAGKRQGDADARWLWPEYHRIIRELKPRWVVGENVPGLLSANAGRLFGGILRDLAACGYVVEWDCIPAAAVGAPHQRDRVWIVARADSHTDRCRQSRSKEQTNGGLPMLTTFRGEVADTDSGRQQEFPQLDSQAPHDTSNWGASGEHAYRCRNAVADAPGESGDNGNGQRGGARRFTFGGCDSCNGLSWAIEPDVGRVAHGVPRRVDRLRALGNAIVPQVAEWIGRRIVTVNQ